jgi:S-phase kinase-associated protein 1
MEDAEPMINVVLPADNNAKIRMPLRVLRESKMITAMLEDTRDEQEITVMTVKAQVLEIIGRYIERMLAQPPAEAEAKTKDIAPWEQAFIDEQQLTPANQALVFELILATNFLDVPSFMQMNCKLVAEWIKGKTPEEIRKQFNIKNDFTPEEEAQVKKENEWCQDA